MKKAIQFVLMAALIVSLSGCGNMNHPQTVRESSGIEVLTSEIDENAAPKETLTDSFSESKTSSDDSVIEVKAATESSQETAPPEEPVPDFNIDYWIGYARSYAESVGLRLESTAVDCWDNPITAGAYSACLDRDIESRLNRYSRDEDITDVWI